MAKELQLIKMPGGLLRGANDADAEAINAIPNGRLCSASMKLPRNPQFLRKFFVMLDFAFDYWSPEVPKTKSGIIPDKNRDKFREDITITAGFHDCVIGIKGDARLVAKSISFANMDEFQFNEVYRAVFNVCWRLVLAKVEGMTEQAAENAINQILSFD